MRYYVWMLVLLALVGCDVGTEPDQPPDNRQEPTSASMNAEAEAFIGQQLPASAQNIKIAMESGIDTLYYVMFDAESAEVDSWLAALGATPRAGFNPFPAASADDPAWWNGAAATGAGDSFIGANGKSYEVLVVPGTPTMVLLRAYEL